MDTRKELSPWLASVFVAPEFRKWGIGSKLVLHVMEQAREDSLAAWSDGRIVKIFKKYKIRNEFSIDYFGYGYRERYKAWFNREK